VEQLPLLPEVTSKKSVGCVHANDGAGETPSSVKAAATRGAAALVPPTTIHWPPQLTATPVCGSPIAETSDSIRVEQPVSVCQLGFDTTPLHPLPPEPQAVSLQPRALESCCSEVPPTATTPADVAGYSAP
jgi:hypothetical protein